MLRPVAQIWLPDGYTEKVAAFIEAEKDQMLQGALDRCFNALRDEASIRGPMALREEQSMVGDELVPQRLRQFEITLHNGIDPSRLTWIIERLCAEADLVDDTVWIENAAVLASLPAYCNGCDRFGHTIEQCIEPGIRGRQRTEEGFVAQASHAHGTYRLRKLGLNRQLQRVIRINDMQFDVKTATGNHNNCLIDTLRQSLQQPDGIPDYAGYLDRVRGDLALEFSRGEYCVRTAEHPEDANYLELLEHTRSVVRSLVRNSPNCGSQHWIVKAWHGVLKT